MKTKNNDIERIEVFQGILKNSINEIKNNMKKTINILTTEI